MAPFIELAGRPDGQCSVPVCPDLSCMLHVLVHAGMVVSQLGVGVAGGASHRAPGGCGAAHHRVSHPRGRRVRGGQRASTPHQHCLQKLRCSCEPAEPGLLLRKHAKHKAIAGCPQNCEFWAVPPVCRDVLPWSPPTSSAPSSGASPASRYAANPQDHSNIHGTLTRFAFQFI